MAEKLDPVNYKAWANNMALFIRQQGLEGVFKDWSGGWPYPGTPGRPAAGSLEICPQCNGSGVGVADTVCTLCNGSGGITATPDRSDNALAEERVWQPIETAPRDGTEIILGRPGRVLTGKFYADGGEPGFYSGAVGPNDIDHGERQATHWMPLPSAPAAHLLAHSHPEKQA